MLSSQDFIPRVPEIKSSGVTPQFEKFERQFLPEFYLRSKIIEKIFYIKLCNKINYDTTI